MTGLLSILLGFLGLGALARSNSDDASGSTTTATAIMEEPVVDETPVEDEEIIVEEPVVDETPVEDGTPVVLIMGQSNAQILYHSGAVQDSLSDLGIDAQVEMVAYGGAGIVGFDAPWNVVTGDGEDNPGWLYTQFLETVDQIMTDTPDAYIAGAIWVQGESDAYGEGPYYEAARTLFEQMHEDTGTTFPISVVGLSDYHDLQDIGLSHVQNAQFQLSQDLDYVSFVDTNAIISDNGLDQSFVMRDGLHYNLDFYPYIADEAVDDLFTSSAQLTASAMPDSEDLWQALTGDQDVLNENLQAEYPADEDADAFDLF